MKYLLKNCRNGESAIYKSTVEIKEEGELLHFNFYAENCKFYTPYKNYNDIHSEGDAFEILIGTDPERKVYYEIEINPNNVLMIAKMTNCGLDEEGNPKLIIDFVKDCFVKSTVTKTENSYMADLTFDKKMIHTGNGDIYFNAFRLETDGGEMEKHLFALFPTMKPKFHVPKYFEFISKYSK